MCAVESKLVLTRAALLAGDYDAQLSGVYGDVASSGEQDSELVPLLKQLIAMLESGGPFYLSSELLNLINQAAGGAGGQHVTNINLGDGRQGDGRGRGDGDDSASRKDKKVGMVDIGPLRSLTIVKLESVICAKPVVNVIEGCFVTLV